MLTFISAWRTAAVVLCDLASTAYYIGGIVEQSIGAVAPWFILGVMIFSYGVRSVYIESCSLFVRGGVYRVVKSAMGGFLGKLSVSALMFDYVLTGPISGVSAGQYIVGLLTSGYTYLSGNPVDPDVKEQSKIIGSVVIACLITFYFLRQNLLGIHESSDKAMKIMVMTTVMAVILIGWCLVSLMVKPHNPVPLAPDLSPKIEAATGQPLDPAGFLGSTKLGEELHNVQGRDFFSLIGALGIMIAFGHSILAMSGEETLAQVYREVEAPKLKNFKKAAFIVFIYSLLFTGGISFLAVMIIPNDIRIKDYGDNLLGGLAMHVAGPEWARFLLNAFVVTVGFLILSGAVNTAIIGSNGVLNRVAEDGVLPDWFLKPHPRYGTTYRVLWLILGMQIFTILASRGNVLLLGEAYAFGVVWSFVFNAMAMMVLRFKDRRPRDYKVPLNIRFGTVEFPVGLLIIFVVLLTSAIMNLFTKELATKWGLGFTGAFMTVFTISEYLHERKRRGSKHEHIEQFNRQIEEEVTAETLELSKTYCKLVAIRSTQNLFMLEKALAETDPLTTDVVVMTAKMAAQDVPEAGFDLEGYEKQLMTAVVERAEKAGKEVTPLVVATNSPLHAVLRTARDLKSQEVILGASNKFTAEEQLDQIALYWISLHDGRPAPLTVRLLSSNRDVSFDLEGGNRIPKISERQARSVAELRAAGVGVDHVLLAHDGTPPCRDAFQAVWTMLDPEVVLDLVPILDGDEEQRRLYREAIEQGRERAANLGRHVELLEIGTEWGEEIVKLARERKADAIVLPQHVVDGKPEGDWRKFVLHHAHCPVLLIAPPQIPTEVDI